MTDLVAIAYFFDPEEAFVAQSYLRADGVDALIQNEYHLNMAPWLRIALGGYRPLAVDETATEARAALNHIAEHAPDSSVEVDDPDAGTQLPEPVRKKNWFWLPIAFNSVAPFVPTYKSKPELFTQSVILVCIYAGMIYSMHSVGGFWIYLIWFLL